MVTLDPPIACSLRGTAASAGWGSLYLSDDLPRRPSAGAIVADTRLLDWGPPEPG